MGFPFITYLLNFDAYCTSGTTLDTGDMAVNNTARVCAMCREARNEQQVSRLRMHQRWHVPWEGTKKAKMLRDGTLHEEAGQPGREPHSSRQHRGLQ